MIAPPVDRTGSTVARGGPRLSTWQQLDEMVERAIMRRGRRAREDAVFADALRIVAAAMRSGATLPQALARASERSSGRVGRVLGEAAARIALGRPIEGVVDELAAEIDTSAAYLFARVVRVQHRRGGGLGGPCHRLAALLHERARLDNEARSATAQARFSARAVVVVPALLAVAAAWRSPQSVAALLHPGPLLMASPGFLLIIVGAIVAQRIASSACSSGGAGRIGAMRDGRGRQLARSIGGDGSRTLAGLRCAGVAMGCCAIFVLAVGVSLTVLVGAGFVVLAAAAWPWSDELRRRRDHVDVASAGIETLLEVSIALFAAGATAHEVATLAPADAPEPLRSALAPAVHGVGLGRTVASAFDLPAVAASPQLDGWLHAICTSAELGAPAVDVLEQLLRDARAARREHLRSVAQTAAPRMQLALVLLVVPGVMWLMLLATVGGLIVQLRSAGVV